MSTAVTFRKRRTVGPKVFGVLIGLLYLFLLAPLIIVFIVSFESDKFLTFPPSGFSLQWFEGLPQQTTFVQGLQVSLITAPIVTVIVVALGVPVALAIHRYDVPGRALISSFFLSPLLVPSIVVALGLVIILGPLGLTNTYLSIIVGHFGITVPYIIRTTLMTLTTSDTSTEEAARVLGANAAQVFFKVTLPIIRPGVIAGAAIVFIISFDEPIISLFVAGSGQPTLPVQILRYVEFSADAGVAALSVVLILISAAAVVVVERILGVRRTLS